MSSSNCELCEAVRMTTWWFEDDVCWVADCESCSVPMVVWKRHDPTPSAEIKAKLLDRLRDIADDHGPPNYWLDDSPRSIPGHYHAHARHKPTW